LEEKEQNFKIEILFNNEDKNQKDEIEDHPGEPLFNQVIRT
jgi:hypothetical protein